MHKKHVKIGKGAIYHPFRIMKKTRKQLFKELFEHKERLQKINLNHLFEKDKNRFNNYSLLACDILLDYSKNYLDDKSKKALFDLARIVDVEGARQKMQMGEKINFTENRAVMHTALRYQGEGEILLDGKNIMEQIRSVLLKMKNFCDNLHQGKILGARGEKFSNIVNIGIGGSDLGPQMAIKALKPYHKKGIKAHFISNIDGANICEVLNELNPATTLFIVSSKSFTTKETMQNAQTAKKWLQKTLGERAVKNHFVAISTNIEACTQFGVDEKNIFAFWDFVGGRYSVWSAIGLSLAIIIGFDNFNDFLRGAYLMDRHFFTAPLEQNMPVILALIGFFYRNIYNFPTLAIVPYSYRLRRFPAYLQQLDMESNGKSVDREGEFVDYNTGAIIWGEMGTNAQHAFFQLLHQGKDIIPVDFLLGKKDENNLGEHHNMLLANCLAQSQALMRGKNINQVKEELKKQGLSEEKIAKLAPHKVFTGNRPSNTIIYDRLSPQILGSLIALYEHKVFVQGVIWNINSFDQWGVELGKQLADNLLPYFEEEKNGAKNAQNRPLNSDSSTLGLVDYLRK